MSEVTKNGCTMAAIAHNHPKGAPRPSDEDVAVTRRINARGKNIPEVPRRVVKKQLTAEGRVKGVIKSCFRGSTPADNGKDHQQQVSSGKIAVTGLVHGYVNGRIDAIVNGIIIGDVDARIESKNVDGLTDGEEDNSQGEREEITDGSN